VPQLQRELLRKSNKKKKKTSKTKKCKMKVNLMKIIDTTSKKKKTEAKPLKVPMVGSKR
jgi:hypothetical protein